MTIYYKEGRGKLHITVIYKGIRKKVQGGACTHRRLYISVYMLWKNWYMPISSHIHVPKARSVYYLLKSSMSNHVNYYIP